MHSVQQLGAICNAPAASNQTGTLPACDGTVSSFGTESGDVWEFDLTSGFEYTFSLCSSTGVQNDSQMDLWNAGFTTLLADGDDECTFHAEIVYAATMDETVQLAIYRFLCSSAGGEGWTLSVSCTEAVSASSNCPDGYEVIQFEDFSSCAQPADWSMVNTGPAGGVAVGACNSGAVFSFDCNNGYPNSSGGGTPATFADCQAVIFGENMLDGTAPGVACFLSPVVDLSTHSAAELAFDWENEDFASNGLLSVEVWTGTAWQAVFTQDADGSGSEALNVTSFLNSDFQVRYCYDTQGAVTSNSVWGMAIDNHQLCAIPVAMPTMGTWALICLTLLMLSFGLLSIAQVNSNEHEIA